ncbi:MAG: hypothetical protein MNPFHGCM_02426 [Gemmatimonadaceae bacterium]|nr:hypothetical protein [Gemmatimonadaceae bacterium]
MTASRDTDDRTRSATDRSPGAQALVVAAVLGFATITIFTELATRAGATLSTVLVLRYVVAIGPLVATAGWTSFRSVRRRQAIELTAVGGGIQAAVAWLSLSALAYISAATLVFLFYTFPVWVTLASVARGAESLTTRRSIALVLAMAGIALTVGWRATHALHPTGVAMALGSSVLYAMFLPLVRRIQGQLHSATATAFIAVGAALICLVGATVAATLEPPPGPAAWLWIVALGVIATAIPYTLFLTGLRTLGPMRTAIVSTVEPFFVALLAALVLDQPLTPGVLVGGSCIVAAIVMLQLESTSQGATERRDVPGVTPLGEG